MSGARVAYAVAGRAQRASFAKAVAPDSGCTDGDIKYLCAVFSVTTSYSRLSEYVSRAWLAEVAGQLPPDILGSDPAERTDEQKKRLKGILAHASRSLDRLDKAGSIELESGGGRTWKNKITIPLADEDKAEAHQKDAATGTLSDGKGCPQQSQRVPVATLKGARSGTRSRSDYRGATTDGPADAGSAAAPPSPPRPAEWYDRLSGEAAVFFREVRHQPRWRRDDAIAAVKAGIGSPRFLATFDAERAEAELIAADRLRREDVDGDDWLVVVLA